MALQPGALREALIDAGASPEKAGDAAAEVGAYDSRLAAIGTRLAVLTWMAGTDVVITAGVLFRLLTH